MTDYLLPRMRPLPLMLLLTILACGDPIGVVDPQPMAPLPEYADWWTEAQECTGRSGLLSEIHWYTVASVSPSDGHDAAWRGAWEQPHTIYLVRGAETEKFVVQHEMLHDLLQGDPRHRHRCFWVL